MTEPLKTLKLAAFKDVSSEVWDRANAGDPEAVNIVKNTIYEVIYGVLKKYNAASWMDPSQTEEFVNNAWARITSEMPGKRPNTIYQPIITKYDPARGASFSTFIFNATTNLLRQQYNETKREKQRQEKELGKEVSLDAPIESATGEKSRTLSETIEDPQSLSRFEDQDAAEEEFIWNMVRELGPSLHIKDPRYMKYLYSYLKASGDRQLARDIAFEDFGLQTYKDEIYNMMHNVVRPLVAERFPEYAKMFGKKPETPTQEPAATPVQEEQSLELSPEEEAIINEMVERGPRNIEDAPIRRLDPKTMQYISSRLNLKKLAVSYMTLTPAGQAVHDELATRNTFLDPEVPATFSGDQDFSQDRFLFSVLHLIQNKPLFNAFDLLDYLTDLGFSDSSLGNTMTEELLDAMETAVKNKWVLEPGEFLDAPSFLQEESTGHERLPLPGEKFDLPSNMPPGIAKRLNLKKKAVDIPLQVWRDYQSTDPALKAAAEKQIYPILLDTIRRAVNTYNPQWLSADDREDFIQKEAMHFKTYSLNQYDPSVAKFDTFVFNNVKNHLNSAFTQYKRTQKNMPTTSLDEPAGEYTGTIAESVPDVSSADALSELSAESMHAEINKKLQSINPRYPQILQAWLDAGGDRVEASKALAVQGINLNPYTVYRMMNNIREIISRVYPEETTLWTAPQSYTLQPQERTTEEVAPPVQEPVYRIITDPTTGEEHKVRISKVHGISVKRLRWADTLLCYLKISK